MRNRHHDAWIFTNLKTNTMKNQCKIISKMLYNIILWHKNV
jgi:hypothetical protein